MQAREISEFTLEAQGKTFQFIKPQDPEVLVEEVFNDGFTADEFLPYWADLWPSSEIAVNKLPQRLGTAQSICEIGCGLGVFATVLAATGKQVVATDYAEESCYFTLQNAERNNVELESLSFDWREPAFTKPFDAVVGVDILYEARWIPAVLSVLDALIGESGAAFVLDPCRRYLPRFITAIEEHPTLSLLEEWTDSTSAGVTVKTMKIGRSA